MRVYSCITISNNLWLVHTMPYLPAVAIHAWGRTKHTICNAILFRHLVIQSSICRVLRQLDA